MFKNIIYINMSKNIYFSTMKKKNLNIRNNQKSPIGNDNYLSQLSFVNTKLKINK